MLSKPSSRCLSLFCLVAAYAGGCGGAADPPGPRAPQVAQAPHANPPAPDGPAASVERKIIYTSQVEILVDDLSAAQLRLQALVKSVQESGGYLSRQETTGRTGYRHSSWTVRVPVSRFDGFVGELETLGELQRNSREAQDVTEAYADLDARLRNKQASELRLQSHLQKTGELKDTLECERELSRVRGEIEQLQGQFNLLKNKTDLATVVVTLFERHHFTEPTFSSLISLTFNGSLQTLEQLGKAVVLVVVAFTPWTVTAGVLLTPFWIVGRFRRRTARA